MGIIFALSGLATFFVCLIGIIEIFKSSGIIVGFLCVGAIIFFESNRRAVEDIGQAREDLRKNLSSVFTEEPKKHLLESEKIIHEYGKVLEKIGLETLQKYPACVYPESLLPYPREIIKRALEDGLRSAQDESMQKSMKACLSALTMFINDDEAIERNEKILKMKK